MLPVLLKPEDATSSDLTFYLTKYKTDDIDQALRRAVGVTKNKNHVVAILKLAPEVDILQAGTPNGKTAIDLAIDRLRALCRAVALKIFDMPK